MRVDSYVQVNLKQYQPVERLLEQMESAKVERAGLVQPLGNYDNSYLEATRLHHPGRFKTVGLIDHRSPIVERELESLIRHRGFSGVRVTAEGLRTESVVSTVAALDAVLLLHLPDGIGPHVEDLVGALERFPPMRIFVPHLGWPRTRNGLTPGREEAIALLSRHPGAGVGISALYFFSSRPFPHEDTWGWIQFVIEKMSPERCLYGSDFPLLLEAESYVEYFSLFTKRAIRLSPEISRLILGESAVRFWRFAE